MGESMTNLPPDQTAAAAATAPIHKDREIRCIDCTSLFTWTAGEQEFFESKGLVNPPKRCKGCKKEKTRRIEAILNRVPGERIDVPVRCASCDAATTVPFFPSQGRPVYCRKCFQQQRPGTAE